MHESKEKMRTIKIKTPRKGEHMTIYTHRQTRMPTRKTRTQGDLFFFLSPQARAERSQDCYKKNFFFPAFFRRLSHWTRHTRPQTHWHSTHKHTGRDVTSQNNQKKNTHFR